MLLIKTLRDPKSDASWTVDVEIDVPEMWTDEELIVTCFPDERMTVEHMMDGPKVTDVSLSPDGLTAAVSFRQVNQSDEKSESWIELRQIRDGSLERSYRGLTGLSRIKWVPTGKKFSYVRSGKEMKTIWVVNVDDGSHQPVLEDVKHLGQHTWAPDGSFIVYSIVQKPKAEDDVLKRLRGMPDRWPTWRERSTLYSVSIPSGIRQRLTAGGMSTDLGDIRPDGQKLIFSRSSVDFTERPYSKATYYVLDLTSMELDTLFTTAWTGSARWSPDGQKILFTGGPEMFVDLGVNVRA